MEPCRHGGRSRARDQSVELIEVLGGLARIEPGLIARIAPLVVTARGQAFEPSGSEACLPAFEPTGGEACLPAFEPTGGEACVPAVEPSGSEAGVPAFEPSGGTAGGKAGEPRPRASLPAA